MGKFFRSFSFCVLFFVFVLFSQNPAFATDRAVYVIYNAEKSNVSNLIYDHIKEKDHRLIKSSIKGGFYFIKPKHLGLYQKKNYIIINLKQINSDVYLYTRNNQISDFMKKAFLKELEKNNYYYIVQNDKELVKNFELNNSLILKSHLMPSSDLIEVSHYREDIYNELDCTGATPTDSLKEIEYKVKANGSSSILDYTFFPFMNTFVYRFFLKLWP